MSLNALAGTPSANSRLPAPSVIGAIISTSRSSNPRVSNCGYIVELP